MLLTSRNPQKYLYQCCFIKIAFCLCLSTLPSFSDLPTVLITLNSSQVAFYPGRRGNPVLIYDLSHFFLIWISKLLNTLCIICTPIFKIYFRISSHKEDYRGTFFTPYHLYLTFEKSIWKNQVRQKKPKSTQQKALAFLG